MYTVAALGSPGSPLPSTAANVLCLTVTGRHSIGPSISRPIKTRPWLQHRKQISTALGGTEDVPLNGPIQEALSLDHSRSDDHLE